MRLSSCSDTIILQTPPVPPRSGRAPTGTLLLLVSFKTCLCLPLLFMQKELVKVKVLNFVFVGEIFLSLTDSCCFPQVL